MIPDYGKAYSIYVDGPAGMETYRHITCWRIDDETKLLVFTDPTGNKQHITTQRYSVEEE